MRRPSLQLAALACVAIAPSFAATQEAGRASGRQVVLGPSQVHAPQRDAIDLPAPPRDAFEPSFAPHPRPTLPRGSGDRPPPASPESTVTSMLNPGPGAGCVPAGHVISGVAPAGANLHTVGEPNVAFLGSTPADADTAFYTGNSFAARSDDGGQTWTHVNPYTRFPNLDGGFCCDQRALYVPSRDLTLWQLLYLPSAVKGSIRIAVATGRDDLRNDVWHSFVFDPQMFGYPAGYWFDYPDMACTDEHLYFAINVVTPTPWMNVDSIVMKFPLDEVAVPGGIVNTTYWTRTQTLGPGVSFRLTQGATDTMYFGTHIDSTTLRVFENHESSATVTFHDRTIASWASTGYVSALPNGTNWAARANVFIPAGYASESEFGFLWNAANQAGRPQPYVRVAKFRTSDMTLIEEEEIWSSTTAYLYPAATTNAVGDVGCVLAACGGGLDPVSLILIVDDCRPSFAGAPIYGWAFSTHSPTFAGWGDYVSVQRHPVRSLGFLAAGLAMQGGAGHANQVPRFLHTGRVRDDLSWSSVIVLSPGLSGVPIRVRPTDELGKVGLTTPGYASFSPATASTPTPTSVTLGGPLGDELHTGYTLTAPALHASGGATWEFQHWRHRGSPTDPWTTHPTGERTLRVSAIGAADDTAEAVYAEL